MDTRRARIEERREGLNMTRRMLADASGVTTQWIHVVETKPDAKVGPATIDKLWRALDAREAELTAARGTDPASRTDEDRLARLESTVARLSSELASVLEALRRLPGGPEQQPGGLRGLEPQPPKRPAAR